MPIFVAQMSMSLLIKPIMAEDALFAFIEGLPRALAASRAGAVGVRQHPTHRYVVKNIPMEMVVAGSDSASISLHFSAVHPPLPMRGPRARTTQASSTTSSARSLIGLYIMQTDANNAVMGLQPVEVAGPSQ